MGLYDVFPLKHNTSFLLASNHWIMWENIIIVQGFKNLFNDPHRLRLVI